MEKLFEFRRGAYLFFIGKYNWKIKYDSGYKDYVGVCKWQRSGPWHTSAKTLSQLLRKIKIIEFKRRMWVIEQLEKAKKLDFILYKMWKISQHCDGYWMCVRVNPTRWFRATSLEVAKKAIDRRESGGADDKLSILQSRNEGAP